MTQISKLKFFFLFFLALSLNSSLVLYTFAATYPSVSIKDPSYQGKYVKQSISDPITLKSGETKQITVTFRNTGTSTWSSDGRNYVSVYTLAPSYRASPFADSSWISKDNPVKISKTIKPSESGVVTFSLTAPSTPGDYTERFQLAAENKTWIKGTNFFLKLKVQPGTISPVPSADKPTSDTPPPPSAGAGSSDHKALALLPSPTDVQGTGGEVHRITVSFKNTGTTRWDSYTLKQIEGKTIRSFTGDDVGSVSFADASWATAQKVVEGVSVVEPGETLQIEFSLQNPIKRGQYLVRFELVTNDKTLSGGTVSIPVTVNEDVANDFQPSAPSLSNTPTRDLITEPTIRVGLYKTDKEVQFQSDFSYTVYSGDEAKGTLAAGEKAMLNYASGVYSFKGGDLDFTSSGYLRLVPQDLSNYFTLVNYERKMTGRLKNFNMYRGILEYKYSPKSSVPYVINELPLDEYIAGVAETSNGSPIEYNKAMAVAERSYAYYHLSTRGAQDLFDVYPTTASQLYLGYNSEVLMPLVVEAERTTHGEMVTYNGKPVVTPYFSRSDGRTRSWKEVWGGDLYPWLQSVETIHDKGKTMLGHGVGISGSDALLRAGNDGWMYDQILKYYYTGVQVEKIY